MPVGKEADGPNQSLAALAIGSLLKPQSLIEQGAVAAVVSTSNLINTKNNGANIASNRVQN